MANRESPWEPFQQPVFRALWAAALVSNIGNWMQDVSAAWLMTTLAPTPLMVALVQAAGDLPVFLLALPAGALADLLDRRKLLLFTQSWMLLGAAILGVLTIFGWVTPWGLLTFTFGISAGEALNNPAWQAIAPELVPRAQLRQAVTLNGVGYNLSRMVGPAFAGFVVAAVGSGSAFLLNAASFLGVVMVLARWRRIPQVNVAPEERMFGAIRAGLRYLRFSPELIAVIVRVGSFVLGASAIWALLPLLVRQEFGFTAIGYGTLLTAFGIGAVLVTSELPKLRHFLTNNQLVLVSSALLAVVFWGFATLHHIFPLVILMVLGGGAWMLTLSTFIGAAQTTAPEWVRGRALSLYLLVFQGGMATGSILWGSIAEQFGIPQTLLWAALAILLGLLTMLWFRLPNCEIDFTPFPHWPSPSVMTSPRLEQGPVLVMIEYRIAPAQSEAFKKAMEDLKRLRRRDGAIRWGVFSDTANPGRYLELFMVESWAEHLRQHERFTKADQEIESQVRSFQIGGAPTIVTHLLLEG